MFVMVVLVILIWFVLNVDILMEGIFRFKVSFCVVEIEMCMFVKFSGLILMLIVDRFV